MYCKYCGNELADNSAFCNICGKKIEELINSPETQTVNEQPLQQNS